MDIYNDTVTQEEATNAWPDMHYRGMHIILDVYQHIDDDIAPSDYVDTSWYQECYLGYVKETDRFSVGFDTDDGSLLIHFKFKNGIAVVEDTVEDYERGFYDTGSLYDAQCGSLLDLRLD